MDGFRASASLRNTFDIARNLPLRTRRKLGKKGKGWSLFFFIHKFAASDIMLLRVPLEQKEIRNGNRYDDRVVTFVLRTNSFCDTRRKKKCLSSLFLFFFYVSTLLVVDRLKKRRKRKPKGSQSSRGKMADRFFSFPLSFFFVPYRMRRNRYRLKSPCPSFALVVAVSGKIWIPMSPPLLAFSSRHTRRM